jgi:hypothetical protein
VVVPEATLRVGCVSLKECVEARFESDASRNPASGSEAQVGWNSGEWRGGSTSSHLHRLLLLLLILRYRIISVRAFPTMDAISVAQQIVTDARRLDILFPAPGFPTPYGTLTLLGIWNWCRPISWVSCTTRACKSTLTPRSEGGHDTSSATGPDALDTRASPTKFALRGFAEALRRTGDQRRQCPAGVFPADTDTPGYQEEVKMIAPRTKALVIMRPDWRLRKVSGTYQ